MYWLAKKIVRWIYSWVLCGTYINIKPATICLHTLYTNLWQSKKRVNTAKSCLLYVNIVTLNKKANKGFACKNGLTLIFSRRSDLEYIFLIFINTIMGFLFYITLAKVMICGSLVFIKKNSWIWYFLQIYSQSGLYG